MITRYFILLAITFACAQTVCAQNDSISNKLSSVSDVNSKVINGLEKQYSSLQSKLDKQSAKLLSGMQQKEDKLHAKLNGIDSIKAQAVFTDDVKQKYQSLQSNLNKTTHKLNSFPLKEYIP